MNTVDKVYSLINENGSRDTFNNNVALFQDFYYHHMSIRYSGRKVITVYQYLLSLNISEEHETMPYINSKIFDDFNNYIIMVTQSAYNRTVVADDEYIESLFCLIDDFYIFKKYDGQGLLNKLLDENSFIRNCSGAMIIALNSSFFNLSNDNISRMMNFIKNNNYLKKIIEDGAINNRLLDKDYFFQYLARFLFNAEFLSRENIQNDIIINALKESRFKDKDTLSRIFKTVDLSFLLEAFDNGLISLVDILEKSIVNEYDRIELFRIVYNRLLDRDCYRTILSFVMNDSRCDTYIDAKEKNRFIEVFCNNYSSNITEEEIKFLLDNGVTELLLINLKSDYRKKDWSIETTKKVQDLTDGLTTYDVDFDTAIHILDSLFSGREDVNLNMLIASLIRLIKSYLNDESVKVYIVKNKFNGCTITEDNCILLNVDLINRMLNERDYESSPESLHILETIFHEARHIQQFNNMKNASDDEMYVQYKEDLLINLLAGYYENNYFGVSLERDARINGAQMVIELLKQYFPYMKEVIDHYLEKVDIEAGIEVKKKRIFELSDNVSVDEALSKLISINPDIINKFKLLSREYNVDGTKKVGYGGFKP